MAFNLKILFISGNLCNGGAQRVISVVASELAEMGHEVHLLLFARNEKEYPLSPKVRLASLRDSFDEYRRMSALSRMTAIRRYLRQVKPDAAVGFLEGGYGLFTASFGMRFAKVASARIDPAVLLARKGLRAKLDHLWFRSADAVVLQTTRQKEHAAASGWRNQVVIANPVSDAALEAPAHDYDRPCRRIVMAGRLAPQKNYPMVLAAMEQVVRVHPEVTLDVYGKGNEEAALRQLIAEKGLQDHVTLRGWTQDTLGEYAQGDLYILSSDYEGMPNALMEAMAVGLPCISTDCSTGPEDLIADGENGLLVPVGDAAALAEKILAVLRMSPDERRRMGLRARQTLQEEFSSRMIARKWERLLTTLTRSENEQ